MAILAGLLEILIDPLRHQFLTDHFDDFRDAIRAEKAKRAE